MKLTEPAITPAPRPLAALVLISTYHVGGPAKGLLQLLPALSAQGVRPVLCTFERKGCEASPFVRAARARGLEVVTVAQRFNFDPRPAFALARLIKRERVQLVQTHGYKENAFGLLLKLATGLPWICYLHGTTDENLKIRFYHRLDRQLVRFADRIVSVSKELARRVVPARHAAKVRVVENAIDARPMAPNRAAAHAWKRRLGLGTDPVIACIGRLSPEKGQAVALDAVRRLRAACRFQLVFVGEGPDRPALTRTVLRENLVRRVKFAGHQTDMDTVYAAADILVLPSFKEGMPNVILEAMLHGLPIVATAVGAVPEMLEHERTALLVPVGDAGAMAAALRRLVEDRGYAEALGRRARASLFPRFAPAARVDKVVRVYAELAANRSECRLG